jgi:DNA-binding transcriptional ArsR family regulator
VVAWLLDAAAAEPVPFGRTRRDAHRIDAIEQGRARPIAEQLDTTQQNISKHIGILQRAGIVGRRRDGVRTPYAIIDPTVLDLCGIVCGGIRREAEGITQALDA